MYIDNEVFEKWMKKLDGSVREMGKDLKSLINTNEVFDNEKLLDNQELCFMLHVSKRTLQRYRSEGLLPFIKRGQKIYYKVPDVKKFVNRTGDYWDRRRFEEGIKAKED